MRDVNFYIDEAKRNSGAKSDRKMCEMLGLAENAIHAWKKKNVHPSQETMMKLAKLAGVPAHQALLDHAVWTSSGTAKSTFIKLSNAVQKGAIMLSLLAIIAIPGTAHASNILSTDKSVSIYYGKFYIGGNKK
jgi:transcriptional regulator with XRE-family HTH domain